MEKSEENALMAASCKAAGVIPIELIPKKKMFGLFRTLLSARCDSRQDFIAQQLGHEDFARFLQDTNSNTQAFLDFVRELQSP